MAWVLQLQYYSETPLIPVVFKKKTLCIVNGSVASLMRQRVRVFLCTSSESDRVSCVSAQACDRCHVSARRPVTLHKPMLSERKAQVAALRTAQSTGYMWF